MFGLQKGLNFDLQKNKIRFLILKLKFINLDFFIIINLKKINRNKSML